MHSLLRSRRTLVLLATLTACDGRPHLDLRHDASVADGATDADTIVDAGRTRLEDVPLTSNRVLAGLSGPVETFQDSRGMWHIYAATLNDALRVQGYLQARDRIGQMEFIRRQATGRLTEYIGTLQPSVRQVDINARFVGHRRNAEAIWNTLSAEARAQLEAYSAGVNAHIADLREGRAQYPRGVATVLNSINVVDWTPLDTLAIARMQSSSLGYTADDDIFYTNAEAAWSTQFRSDATDPRHAALGDAFHDIFSFTATRGASNIDGFPAASSKPRGAARSLDRLKKRTTISSASLTAAEAFLQGIEAQHVALFGDESRGSNSWIVSGALTASGHPILANDPHLALTSPSLFWMAHINTKRAGGDIDAAGQMIAGTHVSLLGFNDSLAWGLTTSMYDGTDVYLEVVDPARGDRGSVSFNGNWVALTADREVIRDDLGGQSEVVFDRVPHHGLIMPGTRQPCPEGAPAPCAPGLEQALSVRWTGDVPSNESCAFMALYSARNVREAKMAWQQFRVGAQTLVSVDREGSIAYESSVSLPLRPASARNYDMRTHNGSAPCFVLDGTGPMEWSGELAAEHFPQALNPARGYVATANADPVGVTRDGNPFNGVDPADASDDHFLACNFASDHRLARINERLEELKQRGSITPEDMSALQGDSQSPYGRLLAPAFIRALDRTASATPDDELATVLSSLTAEQRAFLGTARAALAAWSFETPTGTEEEASATVIADSSATAIFNAALGHLMRLTLDDELDFYRDGLFNDMPVRSYVPTTILVPMILRPETLFSYDETRRDSVFWDDLRTERMETRDEHIIRAVASALTTLQAAFSSADVTQWRWGQLHTLRLDAIVPASFFGRDVLSIPPMGDTQFPNGFPRHGDRDVVDASNFSGFDFFRRDYSSGPQQRLVVEMTPTGPRAWNALPGGNREDPDSAHHRDEMEYWRTNRTRPVPFAEAEVAAAAETRIRFTAQ